MYFKVELMLIFEGFFYVIIQNVIIFTHADPESKPVLWYHHDLYYINSTNNLIGF